MGSVAATVATGEVTVEAADPGTFALGIWFLVGSLVVIKLYRERDAERAREQLEEFLETNSHWDYTRSMAIQGGMFALVTYFLLYIADLSVPEMVGGPLNARMVTIGVALGVAMQGIGVAVTVVAERHGYEYSDRQEAAMHSMVPESATGWVGQLLFAQPLVALGEELLFRGGIVFATVLAFGTPPLAAAVVSAAVFGLYHVWQGWLGVVVASLVGCGFALGYVLTGTLLVAIAAHYVNNVLGIVVTRRYSGADRRVDVH